MPTPAERKALLFLGVVVALGVGARGVAALHGRTPADAAARRALDAQISVVDSVRQHTGGKRKGRGKGRRRAPVMLPEDSSLVYGPQSGSGVSATIDLDLGTEAEIETLRGIGPALARRIVADRDSLGPFGSMDEFRRVRGIGPKLAVKLGPQVTFSLLPRHPRTAIDGTSAPTRGRRKSRRGEPHS